ncbi:MAG TPA: SH3 domain-containing protein [Devosiaceae bacterium]|jgi:SH3-like domain-containing protein|nr:SH3 domain-containing protein [Devosiaceae bacterium]
MIQQDHLLTSHSRAARRDRALLLRALLLLVLLAAGVLAAGLARAAEGASGLPLPRFATTRSSPINVRVGPGTRYDIAWVYVKPGTPVEIVQEFDTWRKIRDFDGSVGWVHQNLLSGKRAGLAAPWDEAEKTPLLSGRDPDGGVRAWLGSKFRVDISSCDGQWCAVSATSKPEEGRTASYSGYLPQAKLWGVYQGEAFD